MHEVNHSKEYLELLHILGDGISVISCVLSGLGFMPYLLKMVT